MNSLKIDNIVQELVSAMRTDTNAQLARKIINLMLPLSRADREVVFQRLENLNRRCSDE